MGDSLLSSVLELRPSLDPELFTAAGREAGEAYATGFNEAAAKGTEASGAARDEELAGSTAVTGTSAAEKARSDVARDEPPVVPIGGGGSGVVDDVEDDATKDAEKSGFKKWLTKDIGEDTGGKDLANGFLSSAGLPSLPTLGAVAGAAIAGYGLDLQSKMQAAITGLANAAGESMKKAKKQINAVSNINGEFGPVEQAQAYVGVAGQLTALNGSALKTAQTVMFMKHAEDLATASGSSLSDSTSAITSILQSFQMNVKQSGLATDVLYTASKRLGESMPDVAQQLETTRSKLGAFAPSLSETAGLFLDLQQHAGETGRQASTAATTLFTAVLKPQADLKKAQDEQLASLQLLPPAVQKVAAAYSAGKITMKELEDATDKLSGSQYNALENYISAGTDIQTAQEQMKVTGITATSLAGIIAQLSEKIKGQSKSQAIATLTALGFGTSSAKLYDVVKAGPKAFQQETAEVSKSNAAHKAAQAVSKTLSFQLHELWADFQKMALAVGKLVLPAVTRLVPILEKAIKVGTEAVVWLTKHKTAAAAVAIALTTLMIPAIYAWGASMVAATSEAAPAMVAFAAIAAIALVIYKNWGPISHFFEDLWDQVCQQFDWAKSHIVEILSIFVPELLIFKYWRPLSHFFSSLWDDVVNFFEDHITGIIEFLVKYFDPVVLIEDNWGKIRHWFASLWDDIVHDVESILDKIIKFFEDLPGKIAHALLSDGDAIVKAFEKIIPGGSEVGKVISWLNPFSSGGSSSSSSSSEKKKSSSSGDTHVTNHVTIHVHGSDGETAGKTIAKHLDTLTKNTAARRTRTIRTAT